MGWEKLPRKYRYHLVKSMLGVVVRAFNPNTQEVKACRTLWVQDQLNLRRKFQDSQGYRQKCIRWNQNHLCWQSQHSQLNLKLRALLNWYHVRGGGWGTGKVSRLSLRRLFTHSHTFSLQSSHFLHACSIPDYKTGKKKRLLNTYSEHY